MTVRRAVSPAPVFFISAAILAFEISLLRILLYTSWHHFAFVIISAVLLGFGASGTLLCFARRKLEARGGRAVTVLIVASAALMPVALRLAQLVPVDIRFVPALLPRQAGAWLLYWSLLTVPFLLGASAVGLALMRAGSRLPAVYGANLLGSGAGAVLATVAMAWIPPVWLGTVTGGLGLLGVVSRRRALPILLIATPIAAWHLLDPPHLRMDPYKYGAYVERLSREGRAERVAAAHGPREVVECFRGNIFHELPFLSVGGVATPALPPMHAILLDGHWAGSLLQVMSPAEASVVDQTLMAVPYDLLPARPAVLLLGETGGVNVWLARLRSASSVRAVQPDGRLLDLLWDDLRDQGGAFLSQPGVAAAVAEPRHFADHDRGAYDLIHLSAMESWAVETGGVGGLHQNHLMTVEGMASCLRRLAPEGILSVCRGIQIPPRDNLKIAATMVRALRAVGIEDPARHLAVVRDFLGVCTMVRATPWDEDAVARLRDVIAARNLTPVMFPGIQPEELNHPDVLPGPEGEPGDWLHHGVTRLLSPGAARFMDAWSFDIRPPTDDRPFFANFGKLGSFGLFREVYGDLWLTRTELALLFVLAALGLTVVAGALFVVAPLGLLKDVRRARGRLPASVYFFCIGAGYLGLEMTLLSKLIHLIGDAVLAGSVTIAGFLVFSGMGSLTAPVLARWTRWVFAALILAGLLAYGLVSVLIHQAGALSPGLRITLALAAVAPLAFLMGFPMPFGLSRLERRAPALVPWAWGINGFASVFAPPLATALAMTWGFREAGAVALALYAAAAVASARLT